MKKYKLDEVKHDSTVMALNTKLDLDLSDKLVLGKVYRGTIGSLLHLTTSRPNIMFSVCLCERFQSVPEESHVTRVKRIFIYLTGAKDIGLWS